MILSPSAAGTMKLPPLNEVPSGAVVQVLVWQFWQAILLNNCSPRAIVSGLPKTLARGGALVERMKRVNASTSGPKGFVDVAASSGSGTVSNAATELPLEVFSVGKSGLVIPISFR